MVIFFKKDLFQGTDRMISTFQVFIQIVVREKMSEVVILAEEETHFCILMLDIEVKKRVRT